MPADIVGTNLIAEDENGRRQFQFEPDQSSRTWYWRLKSTAPHPKHKASMLGSHAGTQRHGGKVTRRLPEPFFVLATRTRSEMEGTYPSA